ncbi:MAG: hypothetical protein Unbinned1068contig1000_38 [Prokaryotic dsDNA virus sp.]|nr:MAG: hypothetical protein Unbinned1068contig1000_38 [Prokaryotic dsDNA virus sp.]|tara:strand:+ start:1520 stop:2923 length:1404 start_codon:yes stop_codon:yes gene_type:complete
MAIYTITLGSGSTFDVNVPDGPNSQITAARIANEQAAEAGDSVRSVTLQGGDAPITVGESVFDAPEQTRENLTQLAPSAGLAQSALEEALELLPEDERTQFRPTLASEGRDTRTLFGMNPADLGGDGGDDGGDDGGGNNNGLQELLEDFEDTGFFELPDNLLDTFGLPDGTRYDSEQNAFVDEDGNVIREASGFDNEILRDIDVFPAAAFQGSSRMTGDFGGGGMASGDFDAGALIGASSAARAALGIPETLEGVGPLGTEAAFLRGLGRQGFGDFTAEGPRTGFQNFLTSLSPAYQTLYGLGSLANNLLTENTGILDALGLEGIDMEGSGLARQGTTFEDFVGGISPQELRRRSGRLFSQLASAPEEVLADPLRSAITSGTNQQFNRGLENLAQSALRGQLGSTGFNLIAGSLPSIGDLQIREAARTGLGTEGTPARLIDQLGRGYGLKKRKVGADGSITEEFFGS